MKLIPNLSYRHYTTEFSWARARVYLSSCHTTSCHTACRRLALKWLELLWLHQLFLHIFWQLFEAHFLMVMVYNELTNLWSLIICGIIRLNSMDLVMWTALSSAMGPSLNLSGFLKHALSLFLLSFILATSFPNDCVVASKLNHFPHCLIVNFLKDGIAKSYAHVWCT